MIMSAINLILSTFSNLYNTMNIMFISDYVTIALFLVIAILIPLSISICVRLIK